MQTTGKDLMTGKYMNNLDISWFQGWFHFTLSAKLFQLYPTLWDAMDYNPPGSFVHGIFQARKLEWVAISFSRRSSRPRDQTQVSYISPALAGRFFTTSVTWEARFRILLLVWNTEKYKFTGPGGVVGTSEGLTQLLVALKSDHTEGSQGCGSPDQP